MVLVKCLLIGLLFFGGKCFAADCGSDSTDNWDCLPMDKFISSLTDSSHYDKNALPTNSSRVNVAMDLAINELQTSQSEFTVYMTVKYIYTDQNLAFADKSTRTSILGDETLKEKIWTPNVMLKDDNTTTVIDIQQKDILVTISNYGNVSYSYKMVAKFYCWLNLKKFPFDTQQCTMKFSDWAYNKDDLQLVLNNFKVAENLQFTEYILDSYSFLSEFNNGPYANEDILDEQFSELKIILKFHRDVGYYLLDFFIPSYLLVFTAWVTFWLQADAGPPRATLGASTVVAFITLHLGLSKDIPKVSYIKASDIWFLGISLFIFTSLAEFAFVNVIWRRKKTVELKKDKNKYILKSAVMPSLARKHLRKYESQQSVWSTKSCGSINSNSTQPMDGFNGNYVDMDLEKGDVKNSSSTISTPEDSGSEQPTWKTMTPQEVAIWIDRKARIVFPVIFLIFNILYWTFVYCL